MTIESEADRLEMLEALGDPVTIDGKEASGILERAFIEVLDVEGHHPVLTCSTADALGVEKGAPVIADGTTFEVIQAQPDGTGISVLVLCLS